jgi:uncharacterized membrane-anchored protein
MTRHRLVRRVFAGTAVLAVLVMATPVLSQQPPSQNQEQLARDILALAWQRGPTEGRVGSLATVKVPEGQTFLDGPNTRRFLELNGNPPRDDHYTLSAHDFSWFAVFYFEDTGYIKDDEKLDPDALLKSLKEGDGPSNKERERLRMPPIYTEGWSVAPHYDLNTRRLEWGVRLRSGSGRSVVNYTTRILSRRGVMHVTLVSDPESLDQHVAVFKTSLAGYDFVPGERYSEFRSGDRVAQFGLGALVLGGAAAVAVKTGAGKALGKFLIYGAVAAGGTILAFLRKLFRRG